MWRTLAKLVVALATFGLPIFYGLDGRGIHAPIILTIGLTGFNLLTGWRAERGGMLRSILIGLLLCGVIVFPLWGLERWFSN
jgi:hypothetical protein